MLLSIQTGDIVDRLGLEKGYKTIKDAGFDAIDWNIDHAWKSSDLRNNTYIGKSIFEKSLNEVIQYYKDELNIIKKNDLIITQAHAPFPCYMECRIDILNYAIEIYKRCIELCNYAGIKNLVIHGASLTLGNNAETQQYIDEINNKLYTSLIPILLKNNVTVCLENLFTCNNGVCYHGHCGEAQTAVKEIDYLNATAGRDVFGFCLDTGHANLLHHDLRVFITTLGHRIKCMHIHDNNGEKDQHLAPLTGTIEWNNFCNALKEVNYQGDLSFETFNQTNKVLDFDEEILYMCMKMIAGTGNSFKEKITG